MAEDKKQRGGAREGAGRKSKADESKANYIMLQALREVHNTKTDDETKIAFVKDLIESDRGKMFVAEHVFGKAKEIVESINHNISHELTEDIASAITKELKDKY